MTLFSRVWEFMKGHKYGVAGVVALVMVLFSYFEVFVWMFQITKVRQFHWSSHEFISFIVIPIITWLILWCILSITIYLAKKISSKIFSTLFIFIVFIFTLIISLLMNLFISGVINGDPGDGENVPTPAIPETLPPKQVLN